jgi:uncharacterized membrane protein
MRTSKYLVAFVIISISLMGPVVHAETTTYLKAKVLEVLGTQTMPIQGVGKDGSYQTIKLQILEGDQAGKVMTVDNDYLMLKPGDTFYLMHIYSDVDPVDSYSVAEPYRIPTLEWVTGLFVLCLFVFGGKQGLRGLLALLASLFFISYLLLPGLLAQYSPILVSMGVASLIIILGSYVTHGFNKTTTAAVAGMLVTVAVTGLLTYATIHSARLSGFTTDEAANLNFNTHGDLDFVGLLLGSMIIGLLGVLYDAAIGQAIAVEELSQVGKHLSRLEIYKRGLRIGREHVGALVNTIAITYVGAALPLLLLFKLAPRQSFVTSINQEVFATEIVRIMLGGIGITLAVPITTLVAVWILVKHEDGGKRSPWRLKVASFLRRT